MATELGDHWERHMANYDRFIVHDPRYQTALDFMVSALVDCQHILEPGAGSGNLTVRLLEARHTVVACDKNPRALAMIERKCRRYAETLYTREVDLEKDLVTASNSYDGVASAFVLSFLTHPELHLRELHRVLRSGGRLALCVMLWHKNLYNAVVLGLQGYLYEAGVLPEAMTEWEEMRKTLRTNTELIRDRALPSQEYLTLLEAIGFHDFEYPQSDQVFGRHFLILRCRKP